MSAGVIRLLLKLLSLLPRRLAQAMGSLLGLASFYLNTRAARVTRANLLLCCPGAGAALCRSSLQETGKTMLETPRVWLGKHSHLDQWIAEVQNEDLLLQAVKADKGLLILLPHTGNWELFNVYFRRHDSFTALYRPPRQPYLNALLADVRARRGNDMAPANRQGIMRLFRTLQAGGVVVVLPDQVPATGRYAPFFGQQTLTDELSSRLLQRTGAQVLGAALLRRRDGRFTLRVVESPAAIYSEDMDESLAAVNQLVEDCARLDLSQYQWEYKRFRKRPEGEPKLYRFDKPPAVH